jgi:hydroxymethylglutaryl-CoA reductase (NADPH)
MVFPTNTLMPPKLSFYIADDRLSQAEKVSARQDLLRSLEGGADLDALLSTPFDVEKVGATNCENLIGSVNVPVGVAGPLLVTGPALSGEVLLPLATTEGALVASINRGCKALNRAGGVKVFVKQTGMTRAPVFRTSSTQAALKLAEWLEQHNVEFGAWGEATSSHLKFVDLQSWVRGPYVFVRCAFETGEAMGMNMVSIAVSTACQQLLTLHPDVKLIALSSNLCNDKKASHINALLGRGRWVQAEGILDKATVESVLHTSIEGLVETHTVKNLYGSALAGSTAQNMHVGNTVAALYLATGQDLAHVTDTSQATTILEKSGDALWASVTLPNVLVGTVGGGTHLSAQTAARNLIKPDITANELAAAIGAACLASELSGLAALTTNTLASSHARLGRAQK